MPQLARGGCRSIAGIGLGLLLAGCGGGSGGSGQGSSQSAAVLQPHSQPEISLSRARTSEVTEEFLFQVEVALSFAVMGVALADLPPGQGEELSAASSAPVAMPCAQGGTVTTERLGGHAGSELRAGDSVRLMFSACRDLDVTFNGEVRLDISALDVDPESYSLTGQVSLPGLRLTSGGLSITIRALLPVTYGGNPDTDHYLVSGGWLQFDAPGGRETITSLVLDYMQVYPTYQYWLDVSGTLTSDWLRGTVHGSTTEILVGQIGQWPVTGRLELSGTGNRAVELVAEVFPASPGVRARLIDETSGDVLESWTVLWPSSFADVLEPLRDDVERPVLPGDPAPPAPPPPAPPPPGPEPDPEPEPQPEPGIAQARHIPLGAAASHMVVDVPRRQFYVAVPERNEIVAIDLDTLLVDRRILVAGRPQRLHMSLDGNTLFATANAAGSVVVLSLEDDSTHRIDLVTELGHASTWDVVEYQPGRLLVTANPSSSGFAYVVDVDLETGEASRVADSRIIRASPYLLHRPGDRFAYVSESFSPNSLYRLDLESPGIPIVLQNPHGSISGTSAMALNAEGSRIVMQGGQVLRTGSFAIDLTLPSNGRPEFSRDFTELMVWTLGFAASLSDTLKVHDGSSFELLDEWRTACGPTTGVWANSMMRHLDEGRWAFLRHNEVCVSDRFNPDEVPGLGDSPPPPGLPPLQSLSSTRLEFSGIVGDAIADEAAGLVYVSIPTTGEVHRISVPTMSIEQTLQFSGQPRGLDLSPDGSVLYVVLTPGTGAAGSVIRVATATGEQLSDTPILDPQPVGGAGIAQSVLSIAPGRMLVNAGTHTVEIRGYENPVVLNVAGLSMLSTGIMRLAPGGAEAYIGRSNVSPPSVVRVSLDDAGPSVSGQSVHGAIMSPGRMALAPDGSRLYLQSGQVLGTGTIMPAGRIGAGVPKPLRDGSGVLVAASPGLLELYDAEHEVLVARYASGCMTPGDSHLLSVFDDSIWLVLGGDLLCAVSLPEN